MSLWAWQGWIALPILAPLIAAPLLLVIGRRGVTALLPATVVALLLGLVGLTLQVWENGPLRHAVGGWGAPLGIDLYADGLSIAMLWLGAVVGTLVSAYAGAYFHAEPAKAEAFWPLWLLLWSGLNALFLSADIFNYYVTLEMLTLSAVPLVTLAGSGAALAGGLRYLALALLGSLTYLLGVALIYIGYGALDLALLGSLLRPDPLTWLAFALMFVGLLIKTALFPFHLWLPPAHASAPAPVSALLSALVVKASAYLLLRIGATLLPALMTEATAQALGALGAAAILYGSWQALRQTRLKLLVAYSTVAQLGYLMLVFPLAGAAAWGAGALHALSHGLAKAALFLAAGTLLQSLGHDRIRRLNGAGARLAPTFFAFGLAGIAIMGLPPSGGFLAKWLLLQAAVASGQWWWAAVILAGGLLAAAYVFRVLAYAFAQPGGGGGQAPVAVPPLLQVVPLALALLALALGFAGAPLMALLDIGSPFLDKAAEIKP